MIRDSPKDMFHNDEASERRCMPDTNETLSRGKFLKLCAVGAMGLAATFASACGGEDDDDDDEEDDDDDEDGGLY